MKENLVFIKASKQDIPELDEIYKVIIKDLEKNHINILWSEYYPFPDVIENIEKGNYFILKIDSEIIGGVSISKDYESSDMKWQKHNSICISHLVVAKRFQGSGYGKTILNEIKNYAKMKDFDSIHLTVVDTNTPAIKLYEKFGFKKVEGISTEYIENQNKTLTFWGYELVV